MPERPLPTARDLTALINRMLQGDRVAGDLAMEVLYDALRAVASDKLRRERKGHVLQTTAVVHDAMVRLFGTRDLTVNNRQHFFALACLLMRRTLIEQGRRKTPVFTALDEAMTQAAAIDRERTLGIERVLARFSESDPQAHQAFRLKIGAGMSGNEVAAAMQCSRASVNRHLARAHTWFQQELLPYLTA